MPDLVSALDTLDFLMDLAIDASKPAPEEGDDTL
jgi:hypothetical protein